MNATVQRAVVPGGGIAGVGWEAGLAAGRAQAAAVAGEIAAI